MDINELEMYNQDPYEIDEDNREMDYSFEDICSSFDCLELQFVDSNLEQTVKNLFRYFKKRSIPIGYDGCKTLASEYFKAVEIDAKE